MQRVHFLRIFVYLLIVFLYLPLLVVVLFAFNAGSNLSWPIQGLSLRWFRLIFEDVNFRSALIASTEASIAVAILSVGIASPRRCTSCARRARSRGRCNGCRCCPR